MYVENKSVNAYLWAQFWETRSFLSKSAPWVFFGHFSLFIGSNISLTQIISSKLYYLISYGKTNPYIKTKIWAKDTQYLLNIFFVTFNLPFWPYNSFWNGLDLVSSKFRPKSSVSLNYNKHMMPIKCQNLNSKTHIYFYQQLCFGCFLAFYSIFSVLARVFWGQHFWEDV